MAVADAARGFQRPTAGIKRCLPRRLSHRERKRAIWKRCRRKCSRSDWLRGRAAQYHSAATDSNSAVDDSWVALLGGVRICAWSANLACFPFFAVEDLCGVSFMGYLQFEPRIPLSLWCTIALAAAVALMVYAIGSPHRLQPVRVWIVSLMTLTAALPLGLLLNPTWIERLPPPTGKPRLTVLVDRSASMAVGDAADHATRFAYACRVAEDVDRKLSSQYDIQVRSFAQTSAPIDVAELAHQSPDGSGTNVAAAIDDALAEDLPQGQAMLLLSDGGQNIGGEAALRKAVNKAKLVACPIYTQTIGGPAQVHDLSVELGLAERVGVRRPASSDCREAGSARPVWRRVNVSLHSDDKVLQQRSVELDSSQAVAEVVHPLTFEISRDKPGLYRYQVDVDVAARGSHGGE